MLLTPLGSAFSAVYCLTFALAPHRVDCYVDAEVTYQLLLELVRMSDALLTIKLHDSDVLLILLHAGGMPQKASNYMWLTQWSLA